MIYTDEELTADLEKAVEENVLPSCEKEFDLEADLVDLCLADHDSTKYGHNWINLVHVIGDLEEKYRVTVSDDDILAFKKVKDILSCFKDLLASRAKTETC